MNHEINDCLDNMTSEVLKLEGLMTEPDEFVAVEDIKIKIDDARTVFERTKDVENG